MNVDLPSQVGSQHPWLARMGLTEIAESDYSNGDEPQKTSYKSQVDERKKSLKSI